MSQQFLGVLNYSRPLKFQASANRSSNWQVREQSWIPINCRSYCDNL